MPAKKHLTALRERRLQGIGEDLLAVVTSTRPAARATAEDAIKELYREEGLRPPQFVWCVSPADSARALYGELTTRPQQLYGSKQLYVRLGPYREAIMQQGSASLSAKCCELRANILIYQFFQALCDAADSYMARHGSDSETTRSYDPSYSQVLNSFLVHGYSYILGQFRFLAEIGADIPGIVSEGLPIYESIVRSCLAWWDFPATCICLDRPRTIRWRRTEDPLREPESLTFRDGSSVVWDHNTLGSTGSGLSPLPVWNFPQPKGGN